MWVFTVSTRYCHILMKLEFSRHFSRTTHIPNFMNICPVGAELFHADIQTDVTKLIVIFCTFVNTPNDISFPYGSGVETQYLQEHQQLNQFLWNPCKKYTFGYQNEIHNFNQKNKMFVYIYIKKKKQTVFVALTFRHPSFTFKFQHTLYVKCE